MRALYHFLPHSAAANGLLNGVLAGGGGALGFFGGGPRRLAAAPAAGFGPGGCGFGAPTPAARVACLIDSPMRLPLAVDLDAP